MTSLCSYGRMWHWVTAVTFFVGVTLVDGTCRHGWVQMHNETGEYSCFRFYSDTKRNFTEANDYCLSEGGYLARDKNSYVHSFLKTYINHDGQNGSDHSSFWIGLTALPNSTLWRWIGGPNLGTFNAWAVNPPSVHPNITNCVHIPTHVGSNGTWENTRLCDEKMAFVCETSNNSVQVEPETDDSDNSSCPSEWYTFEERNLCVYMSAPHDEKTFRDARRYCQDHSGDLIKVTDEEMARFLDDILEASSTGYRIGLNDIESEGTYVWNDEHTPANYTRWAPFQPDNHNHSEDCVEIWTWIDNRWNDGLCDDLRQFICQRPTLFTIEPKPSRVPAHTYCPLGPDWHTYQAGNKCLYFGTESKSFDNARHYCKSINGDLIKITDANMWTFVEDKMKTDRGRFWIGLNDRNVEGTYSWNDETSPATFYNWARHQPDSYDGSEDCATVDPHDFTWFDMPCTMKQRFMCESPPLTVPATLNCPSVPGWYAYPAGKLCLYLGTYARSFNEARSHCQIYGGDLVKVTDNRVWSFIADNMMRTDPGFYWIGLNDITRENRYVWNDETTKATFFRWAHGQPDNHNHTEDCVETWLNNVWNDLDCGLKQRFICQLDPLSNPTFTTKSPVIDLPQSDHGSPNKGGPDADKERLNCPLGPAWYPYPAGNTCFYFGIETMSFDDARDYCKIMDGDLVKIADPELWSFLKGGLKMDRGRYWIGLNDLKHEGKYSWNDETTVATFTNWAGHQPDNYGGHENCVSIQTNDFLWFDHFCSMRQRFICQSPPLPLPATFTCPSAPGWYAYDAGNLCLHLGTYARSFDGASSYCQSHGGDLVKVTDNMMWTFIQDLLSKDPAFYWIGLNDIVREGRYVWNDETTQATFTRWANAQPDDFNHSEDCVEVWPNMQWNDNNCAVKQRFICQRVPLSYPTHPTSRPPVTQPIPSGHQRPKGSPVKNGPDGDKVTGANNLSGGAIAGIVIGVLLVIVIVIAVGLIVRRDLPRRVLEKLQPSKYSMNSSDSTAGFDHMKFHNEKEF